MSGRRALYVALVVLCSLALLVQAGSFSSASAGRDVRVNVVSDDDAYLGVSARGPVSLGASADHDGGHGNDCDGFDDDNPGKSGGVPATAGSPREVNVTVVVSNRFAESVDVTVAVDSREKRRGSLHPGGAAAFDYTNVSSSSAVVVDATGSGFSAHVERALCAR
ncbi:MAG: hypothetical protein ABEJ78_01075 [Haloferacaceae archaeon]